jgi:3-deoxy-D-manno-octulosonate 8-phosphate phosphatase (KDO 8-P phosphatase)
MKRRESLQKPQDDSPNAGPEILERARKVRLVLMDVDGVLTDGKVHMHSDGTEGRSFNVRDGHGIRMGQRGGLMFGIISGRESRVVSDRAEELYITEVHQGVFDKVERYTEILQRFQLEDDAVCYVGDDLVDVPLMSRVGLAVAPADAEEEVIRVAHWVTRRRGGDGAVREVVNMLLRVSDKWGMVTDRYFKES